MHKPFILLNSLPLLATTYALRTQDPANVLTNTVLLLTTLFSRWGLTYYWIIPRRHRTKMRNRLGVAVPNMLLSTIFTALTLPLILGVLFLFHAPTSRPTLLLTLHIALLTLYPLLSIHVYSRIPLSLMSSTSFLSSEMEVVAAGMGVVGGVWASAGVGLLDWGRGWQGGGVPGVVGGCGGLFVGSLVGVVMRAVGGTGEKRKV
ncbi:hypothetical protein SAICODRAFT_17582 [Saitoella complicata NRRL Y-17804]|uniref:uncharacterized protein n=1 Tax=Saitoella complicata (strain BCRC 22490 / CBS 7301 / JCM 7358 / NBRC 10748 / NRRL Y-17804) TaxID=698492 RepID=UPI000866CC50|nr:uncharacterized protein SAICODRAFT_17582 [Saitoella complicata NRRL Y-17804]ODQ55184.1 hypothetical protein SAICODRAFT_17582 [Saitoella complicata NRRL Y-17804]